ncbi:hypothetical protein ACFLTK_02800, partial [Chloroflexota bacterium]
MPQAAVLTDEVKRLIAHIYRQDKKQRAKEVLDKVHEELKRNDWPKLSVIQRELKKVKANETLTQINYDSPWHLGLMDKYSVTSDAVPFILLVQDWLDKYPDLFGSPPPQQPLTIRQALWVSRLYRMVDKDKLK